MSKLLFGAATTALLFLTVPAFAQGEAGLDAFPPADEGMVRQVILLPEQENEADLRVEIVAGKVLEADCNRIGMSGRIVTESVEGWGYDYHVIDDVSQPVTTLMACPDDQKEQRFIPVNLGAAAMQPYNSKLPVVIYTPDDLTVKYRIWRSDAELQDASPE
ncbi:serine protease inhibitor ecotin [Pontibaca methylaminivorans]|uniref:serine protease inhibitor ecotin n=1 Tax=Pontibaca methylaminivorans TaxID=515897 RepID=UPI002FD91E1E